MIFRITGTATNRDAAAHALVIIVRGVNYLETYVPDTRHQMPIQWAKELERTSSGMMVSINELVEMDELLVVMFGYMESFFVINYTVYPVDESKRRAEPT